MMKKIIEKISGDKRILSVYIIVFCSLALGGFYAISNKSTLAFGVDAFLVSVDESAYGDTVFDVENFRFSPIFDENVEENTENVIKIDFLVGGASTNNANNIIYDIALADLEVDCNLLSPYIKWKLVKDGALLSSGSLDYKFDTIKNGRLVLTNIQEDLPSYSPDKVGYHSYTFYMWFSDSCQSDLATCIDSGDIVDQTNLGGKYLSGRVEVELYTHNKKALVRNPSDELNTSVCLNTNMNVMKNLFDSSDEYAYYRTEEYSEKIKNVSFVDYIEEDTGKMITFWDVSESGDESIIAWLEDNEVSGFYDLYIGSDKVIAPVNCQYLFSDLLALENITFDNLYTGNVTDMSYMFYGCENLGSLDFDSFDISNVTNMSYMFYGCKNLNTTITIKSTNVTDYKYMFDGAASDTDAKITVNYIGATSLIVDSMIATKSTISNIEKGSLVA